jgi:hypothetical protein
MKNENLYKSLLILWTILMIGIVGSMLFLSSKSQLLSNIIQAAAVVTLVLVTWFYAKQTQEQAKFPKSLLDEQKLKRGLEFNERRLQFFYNPFFEHLHEAVEIFEEKRIEEIREILEKPRREIFWPHYFMLQKETRKMVSEFFFELIVDAVDEGNNQLEENAKSKLRKDFDEIRKKLNEEREKIEAYISDNYPFPEK